MVVRGKGVCVIEATEEEAPASDSKFWSDADASTLEACACPSLICDTGCVEVTLSRSVTELAAEMAAAESTGCVDVTLSRSVTELAASTTEPATSVSDIVWSS